MPDAKEVYEMVTKQKPPEPGALERQQKRQVRAARNKKFGAFAVAAAIAIAAIVLLLTIRPGGNATTPASVPTGNSTADPAAEGVATGFLEAYGAFDTKQAFTYLADNTNLSSLIGAAGAFEVGSPEGLRLQIAWNEATGQKLILDSCDASTTASGTGVHCTYAWHGLRSDEMGLGPYSGGSFDFTVRDGKIVGIGPGSFDTAKFSPQVWEPFAQWVSTTYPKDANVMYTASLDNFQLTEDSIRLWKQHTREYVKEVNRGTAGP